VGSDHVEVELEATTEEYEVGVGTVDEGTFHLTSVGLEAEALEGRVESALLEEAVFVLLARAAMTSVDEEMSAVLEEAKVAVLEDEVIVKPEVEASTVLEGTNTEMLEDPETDVSENVFELLEEVTAGPLDVDIIKVDIAVALGLAISAVFCHAQRHPVSPPSVVQTWSAAQILIVPN
jgi:hypothetical protein